MRMHDPVDSLSLEIRQVAGTSKNVELVFISRIMLVAEQVLAAGYIHCEKRV